MASGTAMHTKAHRPPAPPPMPPCRHRPPSCLLPGKAPQATQLNRASQFCSRVSTQTPMVASKLKSRSSRPLYYRRAGQDLRARTAEAWTTISPRISDVSASVGRDTRLLDALHSGSPPCHAVSNKGGGWTWKFEMIEGHVHTHTRARAHRHTHHRLAVLR